MSFKLLLPAVLAAGLNLQASVIFDTITGGHENYHREVGDQPIELGDHIGFDGAERNLSTVSVLLYQSISDLGGYTHPITLNLYSTTEPGSLIATRTVNQHITDTGVFQVDFDFSGVTVPDSIYYGLVLNTAGTWAYDWLSFVLWDVSGGFNPFQWDGKVSVGTDVEGDRMYARQSNMNSSFANAGNSDHLNKGFTGAIQFNTLPDFPIGGDISDVPEPSTFALLGLGLIGIAVRSRRK